MAEIHTRRLISPSEILSEERLLNFSEELYDWQNLATYLGFKLPRIQQIEVRQRPAFEMLVTWKQGKGRITWTHVKELETALQKCHKFSLADTLKNDVPPYARHDSSTDYLQKMSQDLRHTYCQRHGKIKKYPWSNQEHLSITNIFTSLLIHVMLPGCNQTMKIALGSYLDMFSRTSEVGHRHKRVLIEGKPGCGKSTLMDKIAYDWATNESPNSPLGQIDLLFYLKMRWFEPSTSIEEAIMKQLLAQDDSINPEELLRFITDVSTYANVCIILDGYDECSHVELSGSSRKTTNIASVLQNMSLKNCIVLVTTRPEKAQEFGKYLREYQVYEVTGFTKENMETYVKKFLDDDKDADDLLRFLENIGLRQDLATMPLLTHLLCLYWENKNKAIRSDLNQESTIFEIYEEIHSFLIQHYLDRQAAGQSVEVVEEEIATLISKLQELALQGLPRQKTFWTVTELQSYLTDRQIEQACKIGILAQDEKVGGTESSSASGFQSSLRKVKVFEFFHKTTQELLAGKHLGDLPVDGTRSFLAKNVKTVDDALELQMCLLFACGARKSTVAEIVINHLCELFSQELPRNIHQYFQGELNFEGTRKLQLFYDLCLQCNFESKAGDKFNGALLTLFPERIMVFYGMQFQTARAVKYLLVTTTDRDCLSAVKVVGVPRRGRVISITEKANTLVDKEYRNLRDNIGKKPLTREFQHLLHSDSTLQKIAKEGGETKALVNEHLWQRFENWQGGAVFVEPLLDGIAHVNLKTLNLRQVVLGRRSGILFDKVKNGSFAELTELNLRDTGLQDEDVLLFVDCIDNLMKLHTVDISYNNIGGSLIKLSEKLQQHAKEHNGGSLRKLDIRDSHIPAEVMSSFWSKIAGIGEQLEEVYSHGASNITNDDGVDDLVESMPKLPNLHGVSFAGAEVTNGVNIRNFLAALSETSVWNIAMYEVSLAATDFIAVLSQGLVKCSNLKWVMLGCKYVEHGDVVPKETFKEFLEVLRSLKLVTRLGLKDVPLDEECWMLLLELAEENKYKELMYSKRCLTEEMSKKISKERDESRLWFV